jgi:hypothetical protein
MKLKLSKMLVVLMAINVLVSTHGFALYEHLCKFTFQKSFSLSPSDCEKDAPKPLKQHSDKTCFDQDSCCEVSISYHKVNVATDGFLKMGNWLSAFVLPSPQIFDFSSDFLLVSHDLVRDYADSSPPAQNQTLYILFGVFRI